MAGISAFIYHKDYEQYNFGSTHPLSPYREKLTMEILKELEIFNGKAELHQARMATEEELLLVHSKSYIDFVKERSAKGDGYLDFGDTPAFKGIFEAASIRVGGSVVAAEIIMNEKASHSFNPGGGFHHAKESMAGGFCVFNDVAIAVKLLQKRGLKKIAIVDLDGHHGDGTQQIFYREPILKISLHKYGGFFYPGSGNISEVGEGEGEGFAVNVPLPDGTSNEAYLYAFNQIIPPLLERYKPQLILNQFGVDGHYEDPLVGLNLTTETYQTVSLTLHELAHKLSKGRYLIVGGGGYSLQNTSRCWAIMFITVSRVVPSNQEKYKALFDNAKPVSSRETYSKVKATVEKVKKIHSLA